MGLLSHKRAGLTCVLLFLAACSGAAADPEPADAGVSPPYVPASGQLCSDNWCWASPYPQGSDLWAVWSFGPADVWAAGADSTVMHWDGAAWSYRGPLAPGATADAFVGLWASAPDDLWMWGGGSLFRWDGAAWTLMTPAEGGSISSVFGTGPSDVWAVGAQGAQGLVARWDGSNWTATTVGSASLSAVWSDGDEAWALSRVAGDNLEDTDTKLWHFDGASWSSEHREESVSRLWAAGPDDVYAYGGEAVLHWNGTRWSTFSLAISPSVMWGIPGSQLWAFDRASEQVLRYDGDDWSRVDLPAGWVARSAAGTGGDNLWIVGALGRVAHWDGRSWTAEAGGGAEQLAQTQEAAPPALPAGALWGTSGDDLTAAGMGGGLVRWDGRLWHHEETFGSFAAIAGDGAGSRWAVGSYARLAHSQEQRWQVTAGGEARHFYGVWAASSTDAWAAGDGIYHHDGATWALVHDLEGIAMRAIWGYSSQDVWAVGDQGATLHWDGQAWQSIESPVTDGLRAVWGFSAADVWAAGSRYQGNNRFSVVLLHWNGQGWRELESTVEGAVVQLWGAAADDLWLTTRVTGLGGGTLHRLVHWDGVRWSEESLPTQRHQGLWGWAPDQLAVSSNGGLLRYRSPSSESYYSKTR